MSFKSWFKRKLLGVHLEDGVEVVDLGNLSREQIKKFVEKDGSVYLEGEWLIKDGRNVFETHGGQQFLVNDDGSMRSMSVHAGEKVVISLGAEESWQLLPETFEALCRDTTRQFVGYKDVIPGFICLDTNDMIRFDSKASDDWQSFVPEMMEILMPEAQAAIKEGLFVFCYLTVGMDESVQIMTPSFSVLDLQRPAPAEPEQLSPAPVTDDIHKEQNMDIKFKDLQAFVLATVDELSWEEKDQLTAESIDALIVDTVKQLKNEGVTDILFSKWDRFVADYSPSMDQWDLVNLWIRVKVQKMIGKQRRRLRA